MTAHPPGLDLTQGTGWHAGRPVIRRGPPPAEAAGAMILVHGRGGQAAGMLDLAQALVGPDIACLAPEARGNVWYPRRFIEPADQNEPDLSSALSVVDALVRALLAHGVARERICLAGFSQGACVVLEATRRGSGVGCVLGFSGGLIGATAGRPGRADALAGLPVLLGCSERDPHIPLSRVQETEVVLRAMGADITTLISPGSAHEVTAAEVELARRVLRQSILTAF